MFVLNKQFVENYKKIKPDFGFNGLGELTFYRTYSRLKENGKNEDWVDCIERVVNTTYNIQRNHILSLKLKWNEEKAQRSAQEMFDRIFNMKFMPPGRGFWAMEPNLLKKVGGAALNNCAFVSTERMRESIDEATKPFEFLMDMSMLGVGVGFDVKGTESIIVYEPLNIGENTTYVIPDTREGWVESVKLLLRSYFQQGSPYQYFDYSQIRKKGEIIKTFGGVASGPEPLMDLHISIRNVLDRNAYRPITERSIVDIMNMIGVCVVAGNVRRTAEIVFGNTEEFMDLKNYDKNPERVSYGWTSNNSIFANLGQDYSSAAKRTAINGEPGYAWLDNMRNYSRFKDKKNRKDFKVAGGNPCLEQSLESYELCCLVETFPSKHESLEDYKRTLKFAYLYAKTVTLVSTHNEDTNEVMLRNRRIGLSQSGISQFIDSKGIDEYKTWCEEGYDTVQYYDKVYSDWFKIPRSIKTTSVKPSGTVSLLAGVTPGMHYPENNYYIRRIRISKASNLIDVVKNSNYHIEDDAYDKSSVVVSIPVHIPNVRKLDDVSMWEQVSLSAFLHKYWADNQVSCTVTFKPEEAKDIKNVLNYFQYQLKGISFLPKTEKGAYKQMPYEAISEETYKELVKNIKPLDFSNIHQDATIEKFCDGDNCVI